MKARTGWIIALIVVLLVGCVCVAVAVAIGGLAIFSVRQAPEVIESIETFVPQMTIETIPDGSPTRSALPTIDLGNGQPAGTPVPFSSEPVSSAAVDTLNTLRDASIPDSDPRDLALRLKGIENIPTTVEPPARPYQVGDRKEFWASNTDNNENFKVTTVLRGLSAHSYVWIEEGVDYDQRAVDRLADEFENQIYPTNRKFFGSEWTPGVDGDPHIYMIFARGLGNRVGGYFSAQDEYHPLAYEHSNAHETFFLNADTVSIDEYVYGTLAHEFQHMIHWYRDRNEESWINEGFSVVAELLNGYDTGGFDYLYASQPDQQLNDWPNDPNETTPYYGSAFLYLTYFLDRFGEEATQALVVHEENGMESVDLTLDELDIQDALTGQPVSADSLFGDWVVTNYLRDGDIADGRYTYHNYPAAPQTADTEEIRDCPVDWQQRTVQQYGVDYIRVSCSGNYTLEFQGSSVVGVLPENPHSGNFAFWTNKGDESDMTLTREFDLSGLSAPLSMSYWTWYDIETDYDYVYLLASEDGSRWEMVNTPSCTTDNPAGSNYGCGYSGVTSSGWIQEEVDLSKYAGKTIQIRFEYITDMAVNGEGLLLDDIEFPALNYATDFETDDGGWTAAGFVRIQNELPQTYRVSLIREGRETRVETITLDENQQASLDVRLGSDEDEVVLVVSGTTRHTRQPAAYRVRLQPE